MSNDLIRETAKRIAGRAALAAAAAFSKGAAAALLITLIVADAAGAKAPGAAPRPNLRGGETAETLDDASALAPHGTPRPTRRPVRAAGATRALTFTASGAARIIEGALPRNPVSGEAGYALIDIATGRVLERRKAEQGFVPASVSKAPTALYALDTLGPDFVFRTRVYAVGSIENGVLHGDLYLSGSGDPVLDTAELARLAQAVADKGIRKVDGVLLYDASALPLAEQIEPTQPVHAAYNPSVSGLNLNFNRVLLKWERQNGRNYEIGLFAHSSRKVIEATTVNAALLPDGVTTNRVLRYTRDASLAERWDVSRKILTRRGSRWLPVQRPARYVAATFRALLEEAGVETPDEMLPDVTPHGAMLIAEHQSMPLKRILRGMLKFSTNLTAEVVGMEASRKLGLGALSFERSGAEMTRFMLARYGLEPSTTRFANHSGLASKSRVSPLDMARLMATVAATDAQYEAMSWLLPRYRVRKLTGATIRAKTGTMYFARGLSGLIECDRGRRMAFAYFNSDIARRDELDRSVDPTSTEKPRGGSRWLKRAQVIERELLAEWVKKRC